MNAVCQAIEQGASQSFVAGERGGPVGEGKVGGDDQARLLVALAEEAEQVFGSILFQGDVAEFVDHDRVEALQTCFEAEHLTFVPGLAIEVGQPGGREKLYTMPEAARGTRGRNCQMAFTSTIVMHLWDRNMW